MYTEWEENPGEAIEMSKHRLSFPISGVTTPTFGSSESDSSPTYSVSVNADSRTNSLTSESEKEATSLQTPSITKNTANTPEENLPAMSQSKEAELQDSHCHGDDEPTRALAMETSDVSKCADVHTTVPQADTESAVSDNPHNADKKLTPSELLRKQARVRESLKMQGVVSILSYVQLAFNHDS